MELFSDQSARVPLEWAQTFLSENLLPVEYLLQAQTHFADLVDNISADLSASTVPYVVGINGCQGSGKTTLADFLKSYFQAVKHCKVVVLSIDDFYLTKQERKELSETIHPLLATRGVPGTHDVGMATALFADLFDESKVRVEVTRFDKALDDRCLTDVPEIVEGQPDLIILEGWCVFAEPCENDELELPVNPLERDEDPDATWRTFVNNALRDYQELFGIPSLSVMLKAPSFDSVFDWRLEQETKLAASRGSQLSGVMSAPEIARFVAHYQRITEALLKNLPNKVNYRFDLDHTRSIVSSSKPDD